MRISYDEMKREFKRVLINKGFDPKSAANAGGEVKIY
jgi:hypothetical protein